MIDNFEAATKRLQAALAELNLAWEEFQIASAVAHKDVEEERRTLFPEVDIPPQ